MSKRTHRSEQLKCAARIAGLIADLEQAATYGQELGIRTELSFHAKTTGGYKAIFATYLDLQAILCKES